MARMIGFLGQAIGKLGASTKRGAASGGGASTAGQPIGLLLVLTKAS